MTDLIGASSSSLWSRIYRFFKATEERQFVFETCTSIVLIVFIAFVAYALERYVAFVQTIGGSAVLVLSLTILKYFLLLGDMIWFVTRVFVAIYRMVAVGKIEIREIRGKLKKHSSQRARSKPRR